jgi:hypothetical protein
MTKEELQTHIKNNVWEEKNGEVHGYGAAVIAAALYKKIYGDFPKIGLSGFQAEAAESIIKDMPEV